MRQYLDYLEYVLKNGEERKDRTGTGTIGVFGYQNRYDLQKGFPLMTTKEMNLEAIFYELKWFLNGDTNIKYLVDNGVNIWNPDAYRWFKTKFPDSTMTYKEFVQAIKEDHSFAEIHGDLGNIYGKQWRSWNVYSPEKGVRVIDQIKNLIDSLIHDPYGRRHIVSAWNVGDMDKMALPPCHLLFQFYVSNDGRLSCQLYQRSADSFLGVPYNIASYSLFVHMIGAVTGYKVGEFVHTFGDAHIYLNHQTAVLNQLRRTPRELPILTVEKKDSIFDIEWEDITLTNYNPMPAIRAKVSVGK